MESRNNRILAAAHNTCTSAEAQYNLTVTHLDCIGRLVKRHQHIPIPATCRVPRPVLHGRKQFMNARIPYRRGCPPPRPDIQRLRTPPRPAYVRTFIKVSIAPLATSR